MLERIQNVLKNRKQNDKGFSLVELAVVIVIIGILVAIAVPVFSSLQGSAEKAQAEAAAANGAAMVSAAIASNPNITVEALNTSLDELIDGKVTDVTTSTNDLSTFCVTAVAGLTPNPTKGPGC